MRISDWSSDVCSSDLQRGVEDVVDQRRLPRAGDTRHGTEHPERERDVDVLQVVLGGSVRGEVAALGQRTAYVRDRDLATTRQVGDGGGAIVVEQIGRARRRESVCQSGEIWVGGVAVNDKKQTKKIHKQTQKNNK